MVDSHVAGLLDDRTGRFQNSQAHAGIIGMRPSISCAEGRRAGQAEKRATMPAKKTTRAKNAPSKESGRNWLFQRLESWMAEDGSWAAVLVGAPGVGKSEVLRELSRRHPYSILVDVRRPLGTHRQEGFWTALLAQTDLEGKKLPIQAYEAARWAQDHLPLDGKTPRLVLIDSLDRCEDLLDGAGLAGLDRPIPGVRLLIATRPTHDLAGLERSGARLFGLRQDDAENQTDLENYLSDRLRAMNRSQTALPRLTRLAAGNFLVGRLVADAFSAHLLDHQDLKLDASFDLPALDRALSGLWDEVVSQGERRGVSAEEMARVACCLSEAGEPLPASSLADFLGLSAARVHQILQALRPLLIEDQGHMRLFHPALSQLLVRLYQRDLVSIHRGVVAYFREAFPSWEEMTDRYGWRFLGHHCDRLARTARRIDFSVLHWLGEGPYLRAKLKHTRSLKAVLDDLHRCLRAALEEVDLPRIINYGLQIPRLTSEEAAPGLHEMADLGELELALERARLLRDERVRMIGLLLLAWQSWYEGKPALVEQFLGLARTVPRPRLTEDDLPLLLTLVSDLAQHDRAAAFSLLDREEEPLKAVSYALRLGQNPRIAEDLRLAALEQGWVWSSRVEDAEERESARRSLAHEKARVGGNGAPPRLVGRDLAPLEDLLADFDEERFHKAVELLNGLRWEARKGIALGALATGLARQAQQGASWPKEAYQQLTQLVVQLVSPEERSKGLIRLIQSLAEAGRRPFSLELVERFAAVAETLEDLHLRSRAFAVLGGCLHRLRDFRNSNLRFSESARLAFLVEEKELRAQALMFVAGCVAETGDHNRARDLAFNSLQASCQAPAERVDQDTRISLAVGLVSSGHEYSTSMMNVAAQTATQEVEPGRRAVALVAVSRGMYRLGEVDWARKLFEQALGSARAVGPGAAQAVVLADLASHCVETGDLPRAEKVVQEALETLQKEARPGYKAEGHLAASRALRNLGNEAGERFQVEQAYSCLDQLSPEELAMAPALQQVTEAGSNRARSLLEKAMKAVSIASAPMRDEVLLALLRAQLHLGEREAADELLAQVRHSDARCRALTDMARWLIREEPGDAVDYLRRIELFRERMLGVRQCVVELSTEVRPSRQLQTRQTLVELTLLSVDDEETADLVLSRWTYYAPNMMTILETMRKMGWSLDEPVQAGTGSIQLRGR